MRINVLLIYHDADLVTRMTFAALGTDARFNVLLASNSATDTLSPENIPTVEIAPIRSKFSYAAITSIRKVVKDNAISVVFCASTSALSNALMATIGTGAKVIGYRGTQARVHRMDPTFYMGLLNPRVAHIVCETPDIEQYLTQFIKADKLSTHPKPYKVEWVADAMANPVRPKIADDVLRLSYVGITKGRPHKGLHHLLDAVGLLNERGCKVHLTVVGQAEESDINKAPANVEFTGNRPDATRYIAGSQLFVLPSTRDASPRVVREAQACSVPCIVTDIPGARMLIETGINPSGVLVRPADPCAIADAVEELAKNKERLKAMSISAKQNIKENYKFESYVRYFADTILKTLNK